MDARNIFDLLELTTSKSEKSIEEICNAALEPCNLISKLNCNDKCLEDLVCDEQLKNGVYANRNKSPNNCATLKKFDVRGVDGEYPGTKVPIPDCLEINNNKVNLNIYGESSHEETSFKNRESAMMQDGMPLMHINDDSLNETSRHSILNKKHSLQKSEHNSNRGESNGYGSTSHREVKNLFKKAEATGRDENEHKVNKVNSPYIPPAIDEEKLYEVIEKGENFDKLKGCKVEMTGSNKIESPIERFEDAKLTPRVLENIKKLGYTTLTTVQQWSIPVILAGRDLMSSAQSGSGKTVAYLIPILSMLLNNEKLLREVAEGIIPGPVALIVAPTRELACQINLDILKLSRGTMVKSVAIYGGLDGYHLHRLMKGASVVVGTVGRLTGYLEDEKIDLSAVRLLVLDEADRMLDRGFHDSVIKLASACKGIDGMKQTVLFSATFPEDIQRLAYEILRDYIFLTVGVLGQANEDIKQIIWKVDSRKKKEKLIEVLRDIGSDKAIVFVQTKRITDALCITLGDFMDKRITALQGDLSQKEREEAIRFFREGKAEILMATSVAARGLDIQGVKHVINYDLPKDINEYVHRIGRTARCGNIGRAVSFFSFPGDLELAGPLVKVLQETHQEVPKWLEEAAFSNPMKRDYAAMPTDGRRNGKFPARRMHNDFEADRRKYMPEIHKCETEEEWK